MASVGVKELKNRLTHYLRRAKLGEELVVTERGKAIALLQPIGAAGPIKSREAKLARLAARGFLTLPQQPPLAKVRRTRIAGTRLSRTILEERR